MRLRYHSAMHDDEASIVPFAPPGEGVMWEHCLEICRSLGMKLALWIAVAVMSPPALAGDVYKCQDTAGKIEFRDRPCAATHKAEKVDVKPNSVGTMTLEDVHARSAELKARQQARQDAESKAEAEAYAAQEWAWQRERALQDAIDRESGVNAAQPQYYYGGYYAGKPPRSYRKPSRASPPPKAPATPAPPPPPQAPAMPAPPPRPPGSG